MKTPAGTLTFRWAAWTCFGILLLLVALNFRGGGQGFTRLIAFGDGWEDRRSVVMEGLSYEVKADSFGYDGQFYAQIALDPSLQTEDFSTALDGAAYRSRRILVPGLAWAFGLGQPAWVLTVYSLINLGFWVALGCLLPRFLPEENSELKRFLRWFGIMFSLGVLDSISLALTDLPMLWFVFLFLAFAQQSKPIPSGLSLALGVLARETAILSGIGHPGLNRFQLNSWLKVAAFGVVCTVPFFIWQAYVLSVFEPSHGLSNNFSAPFVACGKHLLLWLNQILAGNWTWRNSFGLIGGVGLLLQWGVLLSLRKWDSPLWRIGVVYGLLMVCLGDFPWQGYWAVARIVLPMTAAFYCLLPSNRWFYPLWITASLPILHGVIRFL